VQGADTLPACGFLAEIFWPGCLSLTTSLADPSGGAEDLLQVTSLCNHDLAVHRLLKEALDPNRENERPGGLACTDGAVHFFWIDACLSSLDIEIIESRSVWEVA